MTTGAKWELNVDGAVSETRVPGETLVQKAAVGPAHMEMRAWPNGDNEETTPTNPMLRFRVADGVWGDVTVCVTPQEPVPMPWEGCPCEGCAYKMNGGNAN